MTGKEMLDEHRDLMARVIKLEKANAEATTRITQLEMRLMSAEAKLATRPK